MTRNKLALPRGLTVWWGTDRQTFTTSHVCFEGGAPGTGGSEERPPIRHCEGVKEGSPEGSQGSEGQQLAQGGGGAVRQRPRDLGVPERASPVSAWPVGLVWRAEESRRGLESCQHRFARRPCSPLWRVDWLVRDSWRQEGPSEATKLLTQLYLSQASGWNPLRSEPWALARPQAGQPQSPAWGALGRVREPGLPPGWGSQSSLGHAQTCAQAWPEETKFCCSHLPSALLPTALGITLGMFPMMPSSPQRSKDPQIKARCLTATPEHAV